MELIITKEELSKALGLASRVVSLKPSLPVLANILLRANKTGLEILATNLETSVRINIAAKVSVEGETTVPAKIFSELVNTSREEKFRLKLEKENLEISGENIKATLATIGPMEFPPIAQVPKSQGIKLEIKELTEALNQTLFAASVDEGRPVLTGILIRGSGEGALLVATDGYRLARKQTQIAYEGEDLIVPARSFQEVIKYIQDMGGEELSLVVLADKNQILFVGERFEIASRLLEGAFPNFEQIVPSKFVSGVSTQKALLVDTIRETAVLARDLGNVVQMEIDTKKGVVLSAKTAQIGSAVTSLEGKVSGEALKVAFNAKYLLDGLAVSGSELVDLSFSGATSPALIAAKEDKTFTYIVMPVRVQA